MKTKASSKLVKLQKEKTRLLTVFLRGEYFSRLELAQNRLQISRNQMIQEAFDAYLDRVEFPYSFEERLEMFRARQFDPK